MLQEIFHEMMTKHLEDKDGYPITTTPGPGVLRISVTVLELRPSASKDDWRSRGSTSGRDKVFTEGAGSIKIGAVLSDAASGKAVAKLADSRRGSTMWGPNNRVSNLGEVRRMFSAWARQLRNRLDEFRP